MPAREESAANVNAESPVTSDLDEALDHLRAAYRESGKTLDETLQADFQRLFSAADQLRQLDRSPQPNLHDTRNALGAMRGFTEMLLEDLRESQPRFARRLRHLLALIQRQDRGPASAGELPVDHGLTIPTEPGCILAVDDLPENRELAERYLSRFGHRVLTASSGREGLRLLAEQPVDVVLLDLMMPDMDGREVLQRIKQHATWRAIPVIVISGSQDIEGIIACIEAGADDYLFKPFNPVLLQARIKAGIERKRWHDREEQYRRQLERNERFIRATFGRYLSDEIVTDILERPEGLEIGGDLREVTIMMSDIRGFTTLSEQLPPDRVMRMLNRYLATMTEIIMARRGTIDEFIGDAILAVFGAPQQREDDADRAVRCALEMQAAMSEINARNRAEGLPELATGIALNTGQVIAGNIGSERRAKYGFVGHQMNVTSRIEDHCRGGEILLADSTLARLGGRYRIGERRELQVRGIDQRVVVHQLEGSCDD